MEQANQSKMCPHCGAPMVLALPPGGKGPRTLQCFDCDRDDPLKADSTAGWLKGGIRAPDRPTSNQPCAIASSRQAMYSAKSPPADGAVGKKQPPHVVNTDTK